MCFGALHQGDWAWLDPLGGSDLDHLAAWKWERSFFAQPQADHDWEVDQTDAGRDCPANGGCLGGGRVAAGDGVCSGFIVVDHVDDGAIDVERELEVSVDGAGGLATIRYAGSGKCAG